MTKEELEKLLKTVEFILERARKAKENSDKRFPIGFGGGA